MKPQAALAAVAALTVAVATTLAPAFAARSSYVIDDAHMLSAAAVSRINQQVGDLQAHTGKEVLVVTTDTLGGVDPSTALERSFAQNQVNGVEIFIAKNEKQLKIAGDVASRRFFPSGSFNTIYQAMKPDFAQGNFDQGVETGVSLIINTYRGHASSLNGGRQPVGAGRVAPVSRSSSNSSSGGFSMGWIWWLIILAVIFFIIRGIFRAIAGPRMGGGYGPGGPGYSGGYGPGYGGGGGFGGGGGGFWSGMLGGLGGAFLGNELFGNRGGGNIGGDGGSYAGTGVDPGTSADAGGWQSDAGQIDTSGSGGGGWGDSGGGDSGGGWGGGDSGGGGGDSGGGW